MSKKMTKDEWLRYFALLPSIVLVGVFVYGFIGETVWVSMSDWGQEAALSLTRESKFIGLTNYKDLFTNFVMYRFRQDIVNAVCYMVLIIALAILIGLITAVLLDRKPKGRTVFRTVFLYPMALSFVVTGTIWRWLLAPQGGVNLIPTFIGLPRLRFEWLSSRKSIFTFNWQNLPQIIAVAAAVIIVLVFVVRLLKRRDYRKAIPVSIMCTLLLLWGVIGRPSLQVLSYKEVHGFNLATTGVIIAAVWQYSGYAMAMFLAALGGIPKTIHDSAVINGANEFQYYIRIAIPMLKGTVMSAIIILAHVSLKIFALIFSMAGPDSAEVGHPAMLMYITTFRANNFARGAAISVVMFIIAAFFIIPYLINSHRERRSGI